MDGVLDEAAVLCVCKVACGLIFLPSPTASFSPVSFCCCCLLIFTDILVSVFLIFLLLFEPWLPQLSPGGDVIALRCILFLCHTYGTVLLLTTPLIAVEILTRQLWPCVIAEGSAGQTASHDGAQALLCYNHQEESHKPDKEQMTHVVGYLCCLSVWVMAGLDARWRWKVEEVWTAACLQTPNMLIRCLPNLFSPVTGTATPCWSMAFLSLILLLNTGTRLHEERRTLTERTHTDQQHPVNSGTLTRPVDSETTESSCSVHRACSWKGVQMSACRHGDFALFFPQRLCAEKRGEQHELINRGAAQDGPSGSRHRSPCGWRLWGFPGPGVKVITGLVSVLGVFVLPVNLSVNIPLIRTIESVLELCVTPSASSAADPSDTSVSHREMLV
ncbi:uncharacterized protein LOC117506692 [Thalassophryne amazonica]|uniref:uncharacterized protein LOC117506692 n=1 Tax=Thalassophryne amazonica TaxID=390379 RepID=UPI0014710E7A|nr:uncharacterized protein LOC117506692 [Thalassophryne amazonica]XP_034022136.1 uncharacterized protein LOC117506692 [Thalassophryne amazonica]